ncbi:CDP-glucose 4,6-dehydratase [Flavobacterium sp. DSR3-2]|uniref:CDP-glucose 4,6-dehydratase n=1 Tax=Flavobacterium sp. DSR3-2 TaxID=2804634 RepID=UPI003CEE5D84
MEIMGGLKGQVCVEFWKNKRVYLTGHTGFKGSWLSLWLHEMGAIVKGYSLAPYTSTSLFEEARVFEGMDSEIGDIRNLELVTKSMTSFDPDILIHMAAQPLVRLSYASPVDTYATNVMGTIHVLEAARQCKKLKSIVAITTDKCYENKEWTWGYRENEPMGGHDPYSSSKGCCELLIASYRKSFFNDINSPALASVRAGNVIGGGDWSDDRLIPDILKAFEKSNPVIVRNPLSTRPWQHVLEPLSGYLVLAQELYNNGDQFAEGWNFGPKDEDCQSVEWILNTMIKTWGEGASWQLDTNSNPHEAGFLKLDCSKAAQELKWMPQWNLEFTLKSIVDWHKAWINNADMKKQCLQEIKLYANKL